MILVNGSWQDNLSVLDRGLTYGDGLFETIAIKSGKPQLLELHWQRLILGCQRLQIVCPDILLMTADIERLLDKAEPMSNCVIKIIVTRGIGERGFDFNSNTQATRIVILTEWPSWQGTEDSQGIACRLCTMRLSTQPLLAGIKHLNRLEQVMARAEWTDSNIVEGIMLDGKGNIIEGIMSNIFFVDHNHRIITPALNGCGVAGVQRDNIMAIAARAGFDILVTDIAVSDLLEYAEVFISNSLIGIWPVTAIDNHVFSIGTVTKNLQDAIVNA